MYKWDDNVHSVWHIEQQGKYIERMWKECHINESTTHLKGVVIR